ncbi:MAG TPA: electron transfer flavoprotein subunit beta [Deltaproteobacteria bacterium]|nr:electron transfer flavoprotein subunit beta [Deltaproteobacteria bacterium]
MQITSDDCAGRRLRVNIVVLAKQVPDPEAIIQVPADGLKLEIEQKFASNVFDEYALEEALRIKEQHGGKVRVITLGGGKAIEIIRTGIAMGADEGLLLEDEAFLEGDGYATALALSKAIEQEPFDIVLCGKQAIDDDRGEVGQMVAQFLGIPHVGGVTKLDITDGKAIAESPSESGKIISETVLPALFTAQKGLNEPRVAPITGVMKAMKVTIPHLTPEDLGLTRERLGAAGSKTQVARFTPPQKRRPVQMIQGESKEAAREAVRILMDVERVL